MSRVIITMGISGSGKSTYCNNMLAVNYADSIICPDVIRKELTGDISDQTQNARVWQMAHSRLLLALTEGKSVIFDSTATRAKTRKELIKIARGAGAEVILAVMRDSEDKALCISRVKADLDSGKDRSNTLVADFIIDKQHNGFMMSLKNIGDEDYDDVVYFRDGQTAGAYSE